ncbi:hypothetical protein K474DRAFT_1769960 [Panus rudis PR-1116 ss-1]|nr:hypothetical protein K474DRAFT_1769960 [Panus rudis PR-1116 ss-1]
MPLLLHGICRNTACPNRTNFNVRLRQCARCQMTRYCSKECQKQDWPSHKSFCQGYLQMKNALTEHSSREELYDRFNGWVRVHNYLLTHVLVAWLNLPKYPKNHEKMCLVVTIGYRPEVKITPMCMEVIKAVFMEMPTEGDEWKDIHERRKTAEVEKKKVIPEIYGCGIVILDLVLPEEDGTWSTMRRVLPLAFVESMAREFVPDSALWTQRLFEYTREGMVPDLPGSGRR